MRRTILLVYLSSLVLSGCAGQHWQEVFLKPAPNKCEFFLIRPVDLIDQTTVICWDADGKQFSPPTQVNNEGILGQLTGSATSIGGSVITGAVEGAVTGGVQ